MGHHAGVEKGVGRDGGKAICLDDIHTDIKNKECLIYSFGIADDWTFEEYMASLGCKVIILHTFILIPFEKFNCECPPGIKINKTTLYRYMLLTLLLMKHLLKVRHQNILVFRSSPCTEKSLKT